MVASLVDLCVLFIVNNIQRWSQHVAEFHIKECSYLVSDMHRLPQELVGKMLQALISAKSLSLQTLVLFLDDQLQKLDLHNLPFVNDAFLKVIARLAKNITRCVHFFSIFGNSNNTFQLSLNLGYTKIQQIDVLTQFSKLQHLDITNCKANRVDDTLQLISYSLSPPPLPPSPPLSPPLAPPHLQM
jgi:ABC-type transporter Mla maintaining outer membrane lipid asymmetry ATPase subunit MlaF